MELACVFSACSLTCVRADISPLQERMHGLENIFNETLLESRRVIFGVVRRAMCVFLECSVEQLASFRKPFVARQDRFEQR
jgi:hypothetical protein